MGEEHAWEQIRKLVHTGNVKTYIYHFRELKKEIPLMNSAEAYSLFMHRLNPQLHQLVGIMVTPRNLEEVIELVKKATVYGEYKGGLSQMKTEKKQKRQSGEKGGKGSKDKWGPSGGPKGKVQTILGDS